jgi:AcrR family transcriptional regulator
MGNREALLEGARECLIEKGYLQTTARDIAHASGVSLAAIGYHFGTKEALLQEAMVRANKEWGERVDGTLATAEKPDDAEWSSWVEKVWEQILQTSPEDLRMLQASFEVLLNTEESTPACISINGAMFKAKNALISMFDHDDDELTDAERESIGRFYHALLVGARSLQLVAPEVAPTAEDITTTLILIGRKLSSRPVSAES